MVEGTREQVSDGRRRRRKIRLAIFLVIIALVILGSREVLTPFLVALFTAYLIDPVVQWMATRQLFGRFHLGRGGSIAVIYAVLLVVVYFVSTITVPALGQQLSEVRKDLPKVASWIEDVGRELEERLKEWQGEPPQVPQEGPARSRLHLRGGGTVEGEVVARTEETVVLALGRGFETYEQVEIEREETLNLPADAASVRRVAGQMVQVLDMRLHEIVGLAFRFATRVVLTLYRIVLILMVTAFLVVDRDAIVRFIHSLPPERDRELFRKLTYYLDRGLAGVIRGQLVICGVNGILTWLGLEWIGVRYSLLLGLVAGFLSLIPIFGTILSTIPIVLVAWGTGGVQQGLFALGWILAIHFLEANFLNPKIMGTASTIHPVVVIFALIAGEHAYGIVGALLAVPAASLLQSAFKFYVIDRVPEATEPEAG